ncbi:MAG: FeoB-associated Cys-rich membrane protein [Lachnospiraceae bacterium]|nr:FeoB-associated Cys-rich membrane protein [Lachnospiraceae bacterium]
MNIYDVIVMIPVIAAVAGALYVMHRNRKQDKRACGCEKDSGGSASGTCRNSRAAAGQDRMNANGMNQAGMGCGGSGCGSCRGCDRYRR